MLLYIIRHADPIYEPDSLTEKGKLQAQALAKRLAVHGLDRIYTSPMIRAQMTAEPTCQLLGMKAQIEEWTSESLAWDGLSVAGPDGRRHWCFQIPSARLKNDDTLYLGSEWYTAPCFQEGLPQAPISGSVTPRTNSLPATAIKGRAPSIGSSGPTRNG